MITVQWNLRKISRKQLEDRGWKFIRYIGEEWIEMGLGKE